MNYTVTYIRLLVRILRLSPHEQGQLLEGSSLTPRALDGLDQQLNENQLLRVLENLLTLVQRPNVGLYVASRMPVAAHGPLGQLLCSSPDLFTAWQELSKYQLLRLPLVSIQCSSDNDYFIFDLSVSEDRGSVSTFLLDMVLVTIQRGIQLIIGELLHGAVVEFVRSEPEDLDAFSNYVSGTLNFGANKNSIRVPMSIMKRPNPYMDSVTWEQTIRLCAQLKIQHPFEMEESFAEKVRQLIRHDSGKLWSIDDIAAYFCVSSRTVIRKLKAEGKKYQQILDEELSKSAKVHLSDPNQSVESTALSLGYHDTSAFRRAFKRWSGVSPSIWRRQQGHH